MIEIIGEDEGITATEIAAEFMITKGAVSQIISFLEQKELIVKKPSEKGGRATGLFLSDSGRAVRNEHRELHSEMLDEITALTEQNRTEAVDILATNTDVTETNTRNKQDQST